MTQSVEQQRLEQRLCRLGPARLGAEQRAVMRRELHQVEGLLPLPGKLLQKARLSAVVRATKHAKLEQTG